jgi:hypothetical protein
MRMCGCDITTSTLPGLNFRGQSAGGRNFPKSLPDTRFVREVPSTGRFIAVGIGVGGWIGDCRCEPDVGAELESRWVRREEPQTKRVSGSDFGAPLAGPVAGHETEGAFQCHLKNR